MKIQSTQINTGTKTSFKKGLTSHEINNVKNMKTFEYADISRNLKNRFGLETDFAGCNTVAWCVNEVVKIMTRAGFKLPKRFAFDSLDIYTKPLGQFSPSENTVYINSDYFEFTDLESQNRLEEAQGTFHPKTKHFLQTYLHEFSHAAHFQNLCRKHGNYAAKDMMLGYLNNNSASSIVREPLNATLKYAFPKLNLFGIIDAVCPPNNGEYCADSLVEYFAEKNSRKIAEQLGDSYIVSNVNTNLASSYHTHSNNRNLKDDLLDIFTPESIIEFISPGAFISSKVSKMILKCKQDIELIDGDIYHGNIDYLDYLKKL